ncbi:MAG: VCBS repeat-containing protein [Nannocystaceae bacterium]|nr:VCBS repeat-containing protein [Nannocystaceae bacterium]
MDRHDWRGFTEQLLINDGAGVFSDATAAQVTGNPGADDNGIACVDIDNDGDFDAVVLSLQTEERLLQNDGSGNFALVAGAFPGGVDSTLWGEFGDLNGDARLDLVTGQGEFNDQTNKVYFGSNAQPVDDRAPTVIAVQEGAWQVGDEPVVRFAVSDRTMSDEGPRLAMAYVVVVSPGSREELTARFVGGDVFRVELPTVPEDGYQFQACAEDRAGNVGCSESIDVSGGGADTGGAGSGDTAGDGDTMAPDGDGSDNVPGDGSGEGPGSGLDGDSSGSAATDGTGDGGSSDDDGSCSCRTQSPTTPLLWMLLGLPLVWRRSRSRA